MTLRAEGLEPSLEAWKATVLAITPCPRALIVFCSQEWCQIKIQLQGEILVVYGIVRNAFMVDMEEELTVKSFEEFSYFDNLALYYLCNETPPQTLALAFLAGDEKVCGAMLGIMDVQRRKYVHALMAQQKDAPDKTKMQAREGLLLIAENLITRNLIQKRGQYFYGTEKN